MLRDFRAFQLAKEFHWSCKSLRISRYLQDQLLRASSSVALNLAEGSGKRTPLEQRRFYGIALGSLRECEAILDLEQIKTPELLQQLNQLGAILYTLARAPKAPNCTETETETETPNQNPNSNQPKLIIAAAPDPKHPPPYEPES